MSNKNKGGGIVYSTNPDYKPEADSLQNADTPAPSKQMLYLVLERNKGGKMATVVENFIGNDNDLQALAKKLKSACGVGGTAKDGIILIQGDHRKKVAELLKGMCYASKMKGG